jgi:hypothetical protein
MLLQASFLLAAGFSKMYDFCVTDREKPGCFRILYRLEAKQTGPRWPTMYVVSASVCLRKRLRPDLTPHEREL